MDIHEERQTLKLGSRLADMGERAPSEAVECEESCMTTRNCLEVGNLSSQAFVNVMESEEWLLAPVDGVVNFQALVQTEQMISLRTVQTALRCRMVRHQIFGLAYRLLNEQRPVVCFRL